MCRKVKFEFKEQNIYYRLVKQGSILVYLSFHVFTILMILLMATLRQSFLALGYVLIFIPRLRHGSEVLMQRNVHHENQQTQLVNEEKDLETRIYENNVESDKLRAEKESNPNRFQKGTQLEQLKYEAKELLQKQKECKAQLKHIKNMSLTKTFE